MGSATGLSLSRQLAQFANAVIARLATYKETVRSTFYSVLSSPLILLFSPRSCSSSLATRSPVASLMRSCWFKVLFFCCSSASSTSASAVTDCLFPLLHCRPFSDSFLYIIRSLLCCLLFFIAIFILTSIIFSFGRFSFSLEFLLLLKLCFFTSTSSSFFLPSSAGVM